MALQSIFWMSLLAMLTCTLSNPAVDDGTTDCRPDGLSIRCTKAGYEAHTLTVNNKLKCYDGSHCQAIYYNVAVYYAKCGRPGKNVKNYGNRYLRPYEGYSYHFSNASKNKCLEYVIHTCSRSARQTRLINCNNVFDITTY